MVLAFDALNCISGLQCHLLKYVRNYLSVTDDKILGAEGLFQSLFIEPESKARF